jgi:autotransporter-associated beta strand protein
MQTKTSNEIIAMKTSKLHLFKKLAASCGLLMLLQSVQAQSVPFSFPVYEPFAYAEAEALGGASGSTTSATNWWAGNTPSTTSSARIYAAASLSYPGMLGDTNATPRGLRSNIGTGKSRYAGFPTQSGTIYASFLLDVTNAPGGADRLFFLLSSTTNSAGTPSGVWLDSANRLKISKNSSSMPATNVTPALVLSNTYLVVLRYRVTGSNDEVALWLNPVPLGDNGNIPAPTITTTNNANASTFAGMGFYGAAATPMFFMDEIRVDNNWAGVTPKSASPGPNFAVTGGGAGCPGDSFAVGLSGSVTTNVYLLYTNSIYTGTSVTGTGSALPSAFGAQSTTATYSVLASNTTTAAVGWLTNTVAISVLAPPGITTQPASAVVATNSIAVFTVVSSGSGLNYRWYRNGGALSDGGHIAGSVTSTLVISPATTADAFSGSQGYYCVITNNCGAMATSTTNSLTLGAPANIVWQGGNPNTNWDLATTANFTNSAGTAVVFHNGDNVLLDDSSTNPVVTLVGSYIAPTLITEKANQNYALTGSSFTGSGAVLMSGSGVLTVSNANTYSGGTTISNGTVKVQNYNALGGGTVTLAGGTLEFPVVGGSATGLSNNINVTANSTLQYDVIHTYGCVVFGGISGNPGNTLNINLNNATAGTSRFRLYGGFTNNANISLSTAGATNEIAPYGGTQVYNGVISGNGHFITRGATVILNSTNTLSDGTYSVIMSGGTLGLGMDSTFSTPPAIQSSPVGTNDLVITTADGNTLTAAGGPHVLGNGIHYYSAVSTNSYAQFNLGGTNKLTLAGNFQLSVSSPGIGTNCLVNVANTAATVISGQITDGGAGSGFIKSGNGALYLDNANNTYTGPTTNTAGLLAGSGSIAGPVVVNTNTSIGGGNDLSIGTLTINNNLTLNGNVFIRLDKNLSPSQSNDMVSVSGVLTNSGAGTVTVTNLVGAPALVVGDSFKIFSGAVSNGAVLTVTGGGMNWTNKLAIDGSIQALSVVSTTASYPTNISYSVNSGTLSLTWPTTHLGWILQNQTNSLSVGLTTPTNTWHDIANTANVTSTNFPVNPANPTVFFRLRHP